MSYEIKKDKFMLRMFYFLISLFGVALGVTFIFKANIGADPINVFIQGISKAFGLNLGFAITFLWLLLIVISWLLGVKPYIATLLDLLCFGILVDLVMTNIKLPTPESLVITFLYLMVGMILLSISFAIYLKTQLGAGPTMLFVYAISSKTKKSIGYIKTIMDIIVLILGFFLGGTVGLGTIIMALTIGYTIEYFTGTINLLGLE